MEQNQNTRHKDQLIDIRNSLLGKLQEVELGIDSALAIFSECELVLPENHPDPTALQDCKNNVHDAKEAITALMASIDLTRETLEDSEQIKKNLVTYFNGDTTAAEMAYSICFNNKAYTRWLSENDVAQQRMSENGD